VNVTICPWPIDLIFARHDHVARTPEEKRALARHLATVDPETLQWFTAVGAAFGPAEVIGYTEHDSSQPKINSWVEGD
jgi:hypothetical protein